MIYVMILNINKGVICKIGNSQDVIRRKKELEQKYSCDLTISYLAKCMGDDFFAEKSIHSYLSTSHYERDINGVKSGREWFVYNHENIEDALNRFTDVFDYISTPSDINDFEKRILPQQLIEFSESQLYTLNQALGLSIYENMAEFITHSSKLMIRMNHINELASKIDKLSRIN